MTGNSTALTPNAPISAVWTGNDAAPRVVLIHGSLDRMAGMARVARELEFSAHVLRYDRRGYGKSWPHRGPFTIADQVTDLVALLGDKPAVLIGHSFGGNVALACAATFPHLVLGVSTYETPLSWTSWWPGSTAGAASMQGSVEDAAERFMRRLIGDARWDDLPSKTKEQRRREGLALTGELSALRERAPWDAADVTCHVLCGYGERGRDHHRMSATWQGQNLPNAHVVMLPEAAHDAPTRHAREFADAFVDPHLERLRELSAD